MLAGVACLMLAAGLVCFLPEEGVMGLFRMGAGEGEAAGLRTKMRDRDGLHEGRSVSEEYVRKAERGMEAKEIRWVVEDFLALGLDAEYPQEQTAAGYLGLRKAREEWYLGALISGLELTKEQKWQAEEAMGVLREKDYAEFVAYLDGLKSFEHEGKTMMIFDGAKARNLMDAGRWLLSSSYSPWLLCELSEDQKAVTWGSSDVINEIKNLEEGKTGAVGWLWKEPGGKVVSADKKITDPFDPSGVGNVEYMGGIFPLSEIQIQRLNSPLRDDCDTTELERMKILHPEQFKVYLLFFPQSAADILKQVNQPGNDAALTEGDVESTGE